MWYTWMAAYVFLNSLLMLPLCLVIVSPSPVAFSETQFPGEKFSHGLSLFANSEFSFPYLRIQCLPQLRNLPFAAHCIFLSANRELNFIAKQFLANNLSWKMFLELHEAMIRYQIGYCNGLCGFWESRGCKICKTAWISLASSSPASEPITRGIADVFAPIAAAKMRNDSRFHNISASLWYLVLPFAFSRR